MGGCWYEIFSGGVFVCFFSLGLNLGMVGFVRWFWVRYLVFFSRRFFICKVGWGVFFVGFRGFIESIVCIFVGSGFVFF